MCRIPGRADAWHAVEILKALLWGPEQGMVTACPGLMNLLAVGIVPTGRDRPTGDAGEGVEPAGRI